MRPTDERSIRKIIRLCTCLWGGKFNPIIPVAKRSPVSWRVQGPPVKPRRLADGYVKFFEPDVFVETAPGLGAEVGISDPGGRIGQSRLISLAEFLKLDSNRPGFQFGLDVFEVYRHLYDKDFKYVSRHKRRIAYFELPRGGDRFAEVAFGSFPTDRGLRYIGRGFIDAFAPERLPLNPESWIKVFKRGYATPLDATMYRLEPDYHADSDEPTIFIMNPAKPVDLIDFWNLRQFRRSVIPVPISWVAALQKLLREYITANYRPLPRNPSGIMLHTVMEFSRSIPESEAQRIVHESFSGVPKGSLALKRWYEPIWAESDYSDMMFRPRHARLTADDRDLDITLSDQLSCRVDSLSPDFARRYGRGHARWANVFTFRSFANREDLALAYPSNVKGGSFPRLGLANPTIVSSEGFVFLEQYKRNKEYVRFQRGREAIIEWLKTKSIEAKSSDPGRIAEQVISAVGGLRSCRLLADKDTLLQLDKMAKSIRVRSQSSGQMEEEFPDHSAPVAEWKKLIHRRSQQHRLPPITLDEFVEAGILRLGYAVRCPSCGKENWYSLRELNYTVHCERCLREFNFPQGSIDPHRSDWRYRVIGPYSVPDFAGGAYATALALRAFAHGLGVGDKTITYSTNLDLDGGNQEVDFILWYRRDQLLRGSKEPNVVVGETKSFAANGFKHSDIARLRSLAQKLPGAFLVFATLKNDLSASEKKLIRPLATWGRELYDGHPRAPVIVLTGTELFFDWSIEQEWKSKGGSAGTIASSGFPHFDNLWTFAEFTQRLYLDMPPFFEWVQQKHRKRLARKRAKLGLSESSAPIAKNPLG